MEPVKDNKNLKDSLNIEEMSSTDFLSYLYSERDRENSMRQYQGWNIWALIGAIAAVLCSGYYVIVDGLNVLDISQVLFYVSGFLSIILCYRPIALFFQKERGVDYRKVKFLKEVVPIYYLWLGLIVSLSFAILVPILDGCKPINIVSVSWMVSFALFLTALISFLLNKEKVVKSYLNNMIFTNPKRERNFAGAIGGVLTLCWVNSFKSIVSTPIGSPDFELAICVTVAILLFYVLIKVWVSERGANDIDILIDNYLYKGAAKDSTYTMLRMKRMGHTALETCAKELVEMRSNFEAYEQKKERIEVIRLIYEQNRVDHDKVPNHVDEVKGIIAYLKACSAQVDTLVKKIKQIEVQVPEIKSEKEYDFLNSLVSLMVQREQDLYGYTKSTWEMIQQWMEKYHCKKYGGFCVRECENRNDKPIRRCRFQLFHNKKKIEDSETCQDSE